MRRVAREKKTRWIKVGRGHTAPVDVLPPGGEADGAGKGWKARKGFSGLGFYHTREPEELNGLTKAFLGDPEARRNLCWAEELPKDLRGGAPEYG